MQDADIIQLKGGVRMEIIKKLSEKAKNMAGTKVPTIAFLGDSVTQGCFEIFMAEEKYYGNVCDYKSVYHNRVKEMLSVLFPTAPVNIINAGVGGESAKDGLARLERDVLAYSPDLTVVCFGLNDSCFGKDNLETYVSSLEAIFEKLKTAGSEIIFMTPNMMNTYTSYRIDPPMLKGNSEFAKKVQTDGTYELFLDSARELCRERKVPVCDCYRKWKLMHENGVDVTELLANRVNHPTREMHSLFAGMLIDTMFEN